MKTYASMLPRVICEGSVWGLCHMNDFKIKSIRTSCILYAHLHWDASPSMMMSMNAYTMMIMIMIIMPCMIFEDLFYLQTSGNYQLA